MSTSTSTFKKLAARAKAHHESVHAAYETYYSGGSSPRSSTETSVRQHSASSTPSIDSESTASSLRTTWQNFKKAAKEHHEGMNEAFAAYYGGSARRVQATVPKEAVADEMKVPLVAGKKEGSTRKVVHELKRKVKEHHQSVNAAYETYYGGSVVQGRR